MTSRSRRFAASRAPHRRCRAALCAAVLGAAPAAAAQTAAPEWTWRPSLLLFGSVDRLAGDAFAPPRQTGRETALSVGAGLDAAREGPGGRIQASALALVHAPWSDADRGLLLSGRLHATRGLAPGWRIAFDDSAKLQRRRDLELSDFQRNEAAVALERQRHGGGSFGLQLSDRRRGASGVLALDFARQGLSAFAVFAPRRLLQARLDSGMQRYAANAAEGWRWVSSAELLAVRPRRLAALRLAWIEPLGDHRRGLVRSGAATLAELNSRTFLAPAAVPVAPANLASLLKPVLSRPAPADARDEPAGLVGEGLVVDPLESDQDDWDFGRRKQVLVAYASQRVGSRVWLSALLRLQREHGPDLLAPAPLAQEVRQQRWSLRLGLRRDWGPKAALVVHGLWEGRRDRRPGLDYARWVGAVGLQLRP